MRRKKLKMLKKDHWKKLISSFLMHFVDVIGKKRMPGAKKLKKIDVYSTADESTVKYLYSLNIIQRLFLLI